MKAQASLEMVVGLIILLVVAGVVIGLVIHFINRDRVPDADLTLKKERFLTNCETYCKDIDSIEYCRSYYDGNDWDMNGIRHETVRIGTYNWPTCEDRVYCFLVEPCEDRFGRGLEVMEKCRIILCQTYFEKFDDANLATEGLFDDIDINSVCDLSEIPPKENWYNMVFSQGCTNI